jgi:hypothetical protein
MGLHTKYDYDLAAAISCPEMEPVYGGVLEVRRGGRAWVRSLLVPARRGRPCRPPLPLRRQSCRRHGVIPGVFCLGEARAKHFAGAGYVNIAYDTDLNCLINYASSTVGRLKA